MSIVNRRVWYGVQQAGVAVDGTNTFTSIHGLQSIGINTRFNLDFVFEIGQAETYEALENTPDIEVTMEKVLDGYPLLWHLLTQAAPTDTLIGRSNVKATIGLSIYADTNDSASGTPLHQAKCSGLFVSNMEYTFPTNGNCTESITAVGNHKVWDSGTFTATAFNNNDAPPTGVQRREDVLMGSGYTKLPTQIPGVNAVDGYNYPNSALGCFDVSVQQIKIACNLGREQLFELGRKVAYHRYATFPVEVSCDIETLMREQGDGINALADVSNVRDQTILVKLQSGTQFDLGSKNTLSSSTMGGANAQANGGNATCTYSFRNYNHLTITDPADPG